MKKEIIREFAKDLYTQFDNDGNKLYSLRDISAKIKDEFNRSVTHVTVGRWAKDDDWDEVNQKIKQHAIDKANQTGSFSPEEKIIDARSDDLAEVYKYGKLMAQIGTDVLQTAYKVGKGQGGQKNTEISVKEAISAMRTGANIVFRLNDIPDPEVTTSGVLIMPDNGR